MHFLRSTVAGLLCLAALLVPVALWPGLWFPFITAKAIVFRLLLDLAFLPWLLLLIIDPAARPRWNRSAVMMVLTLLALLIADIGSAQPKAAFFSNFERMEGFVAWAYLGLFFFMMRSVMPGRASIIFRWCLVASSIIVCLIAFIGWGPNRPQPNSTFGNPSYVGQFCAMMVFVILSLGRRWYHLLPLALNVLAVFAAGSRGALLALAAGGVIYLLCSEVSASKKLVLGCLAALGAGFLLYVNEPLWQRIVALGVWDNRPHIWQTAWELVKLRPIFGWGQEQLRYAFCAVQDAHCPNVDRAHNLALDWLTQAGIVGLYCWGGFLLAMRRECRSSAAWAFLTVYLVSDLTLFDTLPSYLLLVGMAALLPGRHVMVADKFAPQATTQFRPWQMLVRPAHRPAAARRMNEGA